MSELAKRLKEDAEWLKEEGWDSKAERLLAAAEIVERAEWRPIESAPKDGTVILLEHGGSVYPGRWHYDGTKWPWKVMDSDGEINGIMHGSHGPQRYRPIPAPPEVKP